MWVLHEKISKSSARNVNEIVLLQIINRLTVCWVMKLYMGIKCMFLPEGKGFRSFDKFLTPVYHRHILTISTTTLHRVP